VRVSAPRAPPPQAEIASVLFSSYERRSKQYTAARNALLDRMCNGKPGADHEALQQLSRVRLTMGLNVLSHTLALFDGVMDVEQFGSFSLAVVPRTLSFVEIAAAVEAERAARRAAAAAPAVAPEPQPPQQPSGAGAAPSSGGTRLSGGTPPSGADTPSGSDATPIAA
jgi:hypothetical protein